MLTPCVGTIDLYKTSGHWDHYQKNMFPAMEVEDEMYVLRPMNCPHHMRIYANQPHSYRNLPVRIGEIAHDFRYEASGTLKGIERGRHFCQNDAHLFVTPEQIKEEVAKVCDLIFETYKDFGITDYRCVLSLRDPADKEKYHDDDQMWNTAETALRDVLVDLGLEFTEEIGEAAFYGPKLDVNVKPAVGAEYTLSTCQLDFCLPAKFQLTYVDRDGVERTPVVIHRAILGSLDRFMAYLIEETMGAFPTWLAPVQVKFLPVTDRANDYCCRFADKLNDMGFRTEVDDRNEKRATGIWRTAPSLPATAPTATWAPCPWTISPSCSVKWWTPRPRNNPLSQFCRLAPKAPPRREALFLFCITMHCPPPRPLPTSCKKHLKNRPFCKN